MERPDPCILTINGGSSSIKFALFQAGAARRILQGAIERIGLPEATLRVKGLGQGRWRVPRGPLPRRPQSSRRCPDGLDRAAER